MSVKSVIISAQRCGGLFLSGCLSNHPDVSCPREEIFKRGTIWQGLGLPHHTTLLDFVLNQPFYSACVCRLTYDQAFNPEIQKYLTERKIGIIHLTRDIMPVVTSTLLAKQEISTGKPRHVFAPGFEDTEILDVSPNDVINRIKHLILQRQTFHKIFGPKNPVCNIKYEDMITPDEYFLNHVIAGDLCDFLGVRKTTLFAENRKMHKRSMDTYYRDWDAIKNAVTSAFDWMEL